MDGKTDVEIYYENIEISLWEDFFNIYIKELTRKSASESQKKFWSLQLYALYLQFIEIFYINIFAISENRLFENLFLSNNKLYDKIKNYTTGNNKKFVDYYIENWVLGIKEKDKIKDFGSKFDNYKNLFIEISKDYIEDRGLLNAYKHGFRTKSQGPTSARISIGESKSYLIDNYDSSIIYWSKESDTVFEKNISYKWMDLEKKFLFLFNMLDNTLKVLLNRGKEINIETYCIIDAAKFNNTYGKYRIKKPIRILKTQKNKKIKK